jgi:hypothetical protein
MTEHKIIEEAHRKLKPKLKLGEYGEYQKTKITETKIEGTSNTTSRKIRGETTTNIHHYGNLNGKETELEKYPPLWRLKWTRHTHN